MQRQPFQLPDYCDPVEFDIDIFPTDFGHCTPPVYVDLFSATAVNRVPAVVPAVIPPVIPIPPVPPYVFNISNVASLMLNQPFALAYPYGLTFTARGGTLKLAYSNKPILGKNYVAVAPYTTVLVYAEYVYGAKSGNVE